MSDVKQVRVNNITYDIKDAKSIREPASDGTNGQVLMTDGNGGRSWGTVSGGSGGSSDWDTLTNRPFYANGTTEKTLYSNQSLSFSEGWDDNYSGSEYVNFNLIPGRQYKVTFDGTDYTCVAENRDGYIYMGNEDFYTDASIPFIISVWSYFNSYPDLGEEVELQVDTNLTTSTHSVVIKEIVPNVQKLNPIYYDAPFVISTVGTQATSYGSYIKYYTDSNCVTPADPQPTNSNFSSGTYYRLIANVSFTEIRKQMALNRHIVLKAYNRTWELSANNCDEDDLYFYNRLDLDSTEITEQSVRVRNDENVATIDAIDEEKCVVTKPGDGGWSECHGNNYYAMGQCNIVEGEQNVGYQDNQHVLGQYNAFYLTSAQEQLCDIAAQKVGTADSSTPKLLLIVGNGNSPSQRSNGFTIDSEGNAWAKGNVYVGGSIGCKNRDTNSKRLATEDYVDSQMQALRILLGVDE